MSYLFAKITIRYSLHLYLFFILLLKIITMKKITFLLAFLAVVFTATGILSCKSASEAAGGKVLKFNLEKGKGYNYEMVWDMDTKAMGQESKISVDAQYAMEIKDDDGKIKTVETVYKSIKMGMNVMGMQLDMNSDKPINDGNAEKNPLIMMNKIISGITNKPFLAKVDAEGNVLEVTGFDKIVNGMIDSMGLDPQLKAQVEVSMKEQFNEQTIKDNFAQLFTIFPNKEVKKGDSWEKSHSTGGRLGAKFNTTYTVKDIDGDFITLTAKSNISSADKDTNIEGVQTGNIIVDSKTGLMVNAEFNQDIKTKAENVTVDIIGKGRIKGKAIN
jgi:hypothetical protein